jgi:hypothetical protein
LLIDLNSVSAALIPFLVDLYFWLGSMMVGNFVVWGEHWGKLPWSERFQSPLRCFAWLLGFIVLALIVTHFASPLAEDWMTRNVAYLTGITTGVIGAFYVWFIWSGDWDFTTDFKWVPPLVFYGITILNLLVYHSQYLSTAPSDVSLLIAALVLFPIILLLFGRGHRPEL